MSDKINAQEYVDTFIANLPENSVLRNGDRHQLAVAAFCGECGKHSPMQGISHELTNLLTPEQAVLRVALHLEEMFELLRGLGVSVRLADHVDRDADISHLEANKDFKLVADGTVNLREIIDGLTDSSVISEGTASLLGIPSVMFELPVDYNNIEKFGPGHYFREDGKLVKPEGHPKPDLAAVVTEISGKNLDTDFAPYNWSDVE